MGLTANEKNTKYVMVSATRKRRQTQNWKVGDKVFERVYSFKYLGNVINNPYPTAFPYGNGMVLHFYQQQESS